MVLPLVGNPAQSLLPSALRAVVAEPVPMRLRLRLRSAKSGSPVPGKSNVGSFQVHTALRFAARAIASKHSSGR